MEGTWALSRRESTEEGRQSIMGNPQSGLEVAVAVGMGRVSWVQLCSVVFLSLSLFFHDHFSQSANSSRIKYWKRPLSFRALTSCESVSL